MSKMVKRQLALDLKVVAARDLDGLEMGVLSDGTVFLSGRGLAAASGVAPSVISQLANEYDANSGKPRDEHLYTLLEEQKFAAASLYYRARVNGQETNIFPEPVVMAVLGYYAFTVGRPDAQQNYRALARAGLRAFVYSSLGYDPSNKVTDRFAAFHARLMLNAVPQGLFSVLAETAHVVMNAIRAGLDVDDHTVPDISVGMFWGEYWGTNRFAAQWGERVRHKHFYPDDFPQATANGYIECWLYPNAARGTFHDWLDREYLPRHYPNYLQRKVRMGALPASRAELMIAAVVSPTLPR